MKEIELLVAPLSFTYSTLNIESVQALRMARRGKSGSRFVQSLRKEIREKNGSR